MEVQDSWAQIKKSIPDLNEEELQSLVRLLLLEQEPWLIEKLKQRQEQSLVIDCLGYLASEQGLPWLLRSLAEREEALQLSAVSALKKYPSEKIMEPLLQMVIRQQTGAAKAGEVLLSLGQKAYDQMWQAWFLDGIELGGQVEILTLLTEIAEPRCEQLAFLAIESGEDELIKAGLKAIELLKLKALWGNVVGLLEHPDWSVRGKAANVLAELEVKQVVPLIESLSDDEDVWVQESRLSCMKKLKQI